jgi:hypothetical protein
VDQPDSSIIMKSPEKDSANDVKAPEVRLDRLLGRQVLGPNNQRVGHLEEFRAEERGNGLIITEYVIGMAGLAERLGVTIKLLFGRSTGGYVARWDQLDISDPLHPRLTCPESELRKQE